jgi:hypothetical protein
VNGAPREAPSAAAAVEARAQSCRALPETVYGDEGVLFSVDGAPSGAEAALTLFDDAGGVVARTSLKVPGEWRVPPVSSGDFRLEAGASRVSCFVTVNRELSRASQARR